MKNHASGADDDDKVTQQMRSTCEPQIDRLRQDYGRATMQYDPRQRYRSDRSGERRSSYSDPRRRSADPGGDWNREFIEGVTRLAEDAVQGLSDLANRLADLGERLPGGRPFLPGIPYLGWPFLPDPSGSGRPSQPGTLALPATGLGGTVTGDLDIENTTNFFVDNVRLQCTALVGSNGDNIPGTQVAFSPQPITLRPYAHQRVRLTLEVPGRLVPGNYVGVVSADGMPDVTCLLTVSVA